MRSMLSLDDPELDDTINELRGYIRRDEAVPLFVYTTLENYGIEIDLLINELEKEIQQYGEGDFYDSHWGS
jgi:hypothetical protein